MGKLIFNLMYLMLIVLFSKLGVVFVQANFEIKQLYQIIVLQNKYFFLDFFFIFSLLAIIFVITNKLIFSGILSLCITLIISIINYYKIQYLKTPISLEDVVFIKSIGEVFKFIEFSDKLIFFGIFILGLLMLIFGWKLDGKFKNTNNNAVTRILIVFFIIIIYSVMLQGQGKSNNFYYITTLMGIESTTSNLEKYYEENGLFTGIFASQGAKGFKSVSYSPQTIKSLSDLKSEKKHSDEIVVYVLAESFYDPFRLKDITLNKDPIPTIRSLMDNYSSGKIQLTKNATGTSLSEYEALSSMDLNFYQGGNSSPYYDYLLKNDSHPMVGNLFDHSIAIHTYHAGNYNRKNIFEQIYKFDKFKFEGNKKYDLVFKDKIDNHQYISDKSGFQEVLYELNKIPKGESGFIFYLTMQNHSPYNSEYYKNLQFDIETSKHKLKNSEIEQLKIYFEGLHYTDIAVKSFIEELEKIDRKITFVFFGDHSPRVDEKIFYKDEMNKTEYFIYQNYQQKKLDYPLISTNYLATVMLKLSTIPKSPFYKVLDRQFDLSNLIYEEKYLDSESKEMMPIDNNGKLKNALYYYDIIHTDVLTNRDILPKEFFVND